MKDNQIAELLEKYKTGGLTPKEKTVLENWYLHQAANSKFEPDADKIYKNLELIGKQLPLKRHAVYIKPLWRSVAAASIFIFIIFGSYFLLHKQVTTQQIAKNQMPPLDIAAGTYKATLTLSSGKQISLSDARNGIIARENKEVIQKSADGTIEYKGSPPIDDEKNLLYNTITTPKGGQWPVVLPDGSRVILNAASSLRYPISFTKNERKVELTGEAYFEVAHNVAKPFRVVSNGQTVEVLGTHFNINAYSDEPAMITTLLEGSVKVVKNNTSVMIKPGEDAVWTNRGHQFKVEQVDLDEAVAWKNGLFQFNHTSIDVVMRQAARWYDVEIIYKGDIPKLTLTGNLPRNVNVSRLLKMLSITGVHFNIEGKKIIVTP
jgi:hypothetical protein